MGRLRECWNDGRPRAIRGPAEERNSMMFYQENAQTALEKAFELARSGKCLNVTDIVKRLRSERYDVDQIHGPALKKKLMELIEQSRAPGLPKVLGESSVPPSVCA